MTKQSIKSENMSSSDEEGSEFEMDLNGDSINGDRDVKPKTKSPKTAQGKKTTARRVESSSSSLKSPSKPSSLGNINKIGKAILRRVLEGQAIDRAAIATECAVPRGHVDNYMNSKGQWRTIKTAIYKDYGLDKP